MDKTDTKRSGSSVPWLAIGLLVLGLVAGRAILRQQSSLQEGAPAFELCAALPPIVVEGWLNSPGPITTDQLRGQVVLVDYWATWCGPCRAAMPDLVELKEKYRDQDVLVLGMTSEPAAKLSAIRQFADSVPGLDWPIAYGAKSAFQAMEVRMMPTLVVFDRKGNPTWMGHGIDQAEDALVNALAGG